MKPEEIRRASALIEKIAALKIGMQSVKGTTMTMDNSITIGSIRTTLHPDEARGFAERLIQNAELELEKLGVDL